MNRANRRKQQRQKRQDKTVPSSANSATSSGAYWKSVYVPPPEGTIVTDVRCSTGAQP